MRVIFRPCASRGPRFASVAATDAFADFPSTSLDIVSVGPVFVFTIAEIVGPASRHNVAKRFLHVVALSSRTIVFIVYITRRRDETPRRPEDPRAALVHAGGGRVVRESFSLHLRLPPPPLNATTRE